MWQTHKQENKSRWQIFPSDVWGRDRKIASRWCKQVQDRKLLFDYNDAYQIFYLQVWLNSAIIFLVETLRNPVAYMHDDVGVFRYTHWSTADWNDMSVYCMIARQSVNSVNSSVFMVTVNTVYICRNHHDSDCMHLSNQVTQKPVYPFRRSKPTGSNFKLLQSAVN